MEAPAKQKIFKYVIGSATGMLPEHPIVRMPPSARIISLQTQADQIVCWALVDEGDIDYRNRQFHILGTGWEPTDITGWSYVDTVQHMYLVWHVFVEEVD